MADVLAGLKRMRSAVLAAGLIVVSGPALASPDWAVVDMRDTLREVSRMLVEDPDKRALPLDEVLKDIDWDAPVITSETAVLEDITGPARLGWMDVRLALAPIHHVFGAKGAGPIERALGRYGTEAIVIEEGIATLEMLRDGLTNRQLSYDLESDRYTLRVPLVVGEGATLRLSVRDDLALSRAEGAFVVGLGRIEIVGAKVHATAEANEDAPRFRPFITALGGAVIEDAWFADLGFGNSVKYSGVSALSHPTFSPNARTIIRRNRFDHLVTLSVVGLPNSEIEFNRFFSMERNALLVARARNASIVGNLFSGPSPTNAVRILHGSDNARLVGNVILEGARAGFLVSDGSDNALVDGNLIWRRNGGGIKLSDVVCGVVQRNIVLDDKQKGVEVRASANVTVRANEIIGNRNAGIWVSSQREDSVTYVSGNLIRENGSGLSSAQGGEIALWGNDLRNQFPRFLDGELTHHFRSIAADLTGDVPLAISAVGTRKTAVPMATDCARQAH